MVQLCVCVYVCVCVCISKKSRPIKERTQKNDNWLATCLVLYNAAAATAAATAAAACSMYR